MAFLRTLWNRSAAVDTSADTDQHRSAEVGTGLAPVCTGPHQGDHQLAPVDTDPDNAPIINPMGALRTPKEHAVQLLDLLRGTGLEGRAVLASELEECHQLLCERLGWMPRRWAGIGRELRKLHGVRRGQVWVGPYRMTAYTIGPPAEPAVVELSEEKRRRA